MSDSPQDPGTLRSLDDALAAIQQLQASEPRTCAERLDALNRSADSTIWLEIVREILCPSADAAGPRVTFLLNRLAQAGFDHEAARVATAMLIAQAPAVLESWADWMHVADRDELRLRLEVIARSERFSESLVDFITFSFRASVSDLYQAAAIALGRHLHHSEPLRDYLVRFAQERSIPLEEPIQLNGKRSPRRILLAMSAARSPEPAAKLLPDSRPQFTGSIPIMRNEAGEAAVTLPESSADLFILLLAIELALISSDDPTHVNPIADAALEAVAHTGFPGFRASEAGRGPIITRTVLKQFGALLIRRQHEQTADLWWSIFERQRAQLAALPADSFAKRVAALNRIDELMRTLALLPPDADSHAEAIASRLVQHFRDDELRYLGLRARLWSAREHNLRSSHSATRSPLSALVALGEQRTADSEHRAVLADLTDVLDWLSRFVERLGDAPPNLPGTSGELAGELAGELPGDFRGNLRGTGQMLDARTVETAQARLLAQLLSTLSSQSTWLSHDESTRALIAALLIDQTQHLRLPSSQVAMLLNRFGFVLSADSQQRIANSEATMQVLLRLLAWEKPGTEELIDTKMLHRIDDPRVLLALVPTGRRSSVLPLLADAFEHQIRQRLRSDDDFSPDGFLALISVRRPYRGLYTALASVCEDRTYIDAAGRTVPLHEMIEDRGLRIEDRVPLTPRSSPLTPHLRDRLRALQLESTDVRVRLAHCAELVGESPDGQPPRAETLLALLTTLHEPYAAVLQHGYPAWREESLSTIERQVSEQLAILRSAGHGLLPDDWTHGGSAREHAASARSALAAVCETLSRSLPADIADLLEATVRSLDRELVHWIEIIENVVERWPEERLHPHELQLDLCNEAVADVLQTDHDLLREHMLGLLWRSLRNWAAADGADDPWSREKALLDWGVRYRSRGSDQHEKSRIWHEALTATWIELVHAAMSRRHEQRMRHLLEDDRYEALRTAPAASETLEQAHRWCLDRYMLDAAHRAASDIRAGRSQSTPLKLRTFGAFLVHYSSVWLALMIGSILMLDFGDAWAAMAEPDIGDLRGISLTFFIGVGGAFAYVLWNLKQKTQLSPGEPRGPARRLQLARAGGFVTLCMIYTLAITSFLWWLLSETDEVVHGVWAIGHIIVWSGFALFVGVFFGMIGGKGA